MNCNDVQRLHQVQLDGEWLSPADTDAVSRHRAECPVCAHELAQREELAATFRALPAVKAPAPALTALRSRLKTAAPTPELTCAECRQILADHLDRQIPAHLSEPLAVHLATCTRCAQATVEVDAEDHIPALFAALPPVTPPADLRAALKRRLSGPEARPVEPLSCDKAERLLSDRLDEQLPADVQTRLDVHLATCTKCTRFAVALEEQQALLHSLAEAPMPADLPRQIAARLAGQRLSLALTVLAAIRRSRQAMLSIGLGAIATAGIALGVLNANLHAPVVPAATTRRAHPAAVAVHRPATRSTSPEQPTSTPADRRPSVVPPTPVLRVVKNEPSPAPWVSRRTRSRTASRAETPAVAAVSPPPVAAAGAAVPETTSPATEPATPSSTSEPVVVSAGPSAATIAATTQPAATATETPGTAAEVTTATRDTTPAARTAPAPRMPVYIDDSPDHAPSPGALPRPERRSPAEQPEPPAFEAPPVETAVAVASTTPTAHDTDELARLRRKLHRRRPAVADSERIAGVPDRMATVDLLKVEF